ncbi:hypothetical protein AC579_9072 [Pseudocercospora musae]|uniref:Uncharacterized protein n=1 Tax=Pseudocercospora musae TaxID=113226 RepID=A0A139IF82_9PEZI|nr:hypothetical protein AC579_9072 [Pseudocercospora musae]
MAREGNQDRFKLWIAAKVNFGLHTTILFAGAVFVLVWDLSLVRLPLSKLFQVHGVRPLGEEVELRKLTSDRFSSPVSAIREVSELRGQLQKMHEENKLYYRAIKLQDQVAHANIKSFPPSCNKIVHNKGKGSLLDVLLSSLASALDTLSQQTG